MRLLPRKDRNDPRDSSSLVGSGSNGGMTLSSKSERGGSKSRSSLTKLLHGIDRSHHGSKFLNKHKSKNMSELMQGRLHDLERGTSSLAKMDDNGEIDSVADSSRSAVVENWGQDVGHSQSQVMSPSRKIDNSNRRPGGKAATLENLGPSIENYSTLVSDDADDHFSNKDDPDDLDEPEDVIPIHVNTPNVRETLDRARDKAKVRERERAESETYRTRSSKSVNSSGVNDAVRKSRHGATSQQTFAKDKDSLRKSRHGSSRHLDDTLHKPRHGENHRASTGDLNMHKTTHGQTGARRSASSVEDLLRSSLHGERDREYGRDKAKASDSLRKSRYGSSASSNSGQVIESLHKSYQGTDNQDFLKYSSKDRTSDVKVADLLSRSLHGDERNDAVRKPRHGGSNTSRSRHGVSTTHKARQSPKDNIQRSRHGSRKDVKDLLAPSRHGARPSSDLEQELRGSEALSASICCVCNEPARTYLQALNKKYHHACFNCVGCHEPIDPTAPFTYMSEGGEKHPLHMSCHSELYSMKCTVCLNPIPAGADGKIKYTKHPFFSNEVMCPTHVVETIETGTMMKNGSMSLTSRSKRPVRRCTSCHRFEPLKGKGFLDLGDLDRCVCMACCRTIVCDSVDAQPLWRKILRFWEKNLNLPVWEGMKEVPILVVGSDVMFEQVALGGSAGTTHHHTTMARGLCLGEQQATNLPSSVTDDGKPLPTTKSPELTAILCLTGLPSDLTASVLAHEAMHAWFKLHPEFGASNHTIPPNVEEGCAQLISYLYLCEREESASESKKRSTRNEDGPSDEMLRQYFKYSIESDPTEVFGDGFREASRAYSEVGIEMLLNHVAYYREFPDI